MLVIFISLSIDKLNKMSCDSLVVEALTENSISKLRTAWSFIRLGSYSRGELVNTLVRCDENGDTPLVIAMRKKHYAIMDELMPLLKNSYLVVEECHRLCSRAIDQLLSHQIPVVEMLDHLIEDTQNYLWLKFITEACIKSSSITREQKIIVWELVGATFIIASTCDPYTSSKRGLEWLKEAQALRDSPAGGGPPLLKVPLCSHSAVSRKVFGPAVEVMSIDQLDDLEIQFVTSLPHEEGFQVRFEILQIQALLVLRRICSQLSPRQSSPYWIYLRSLLRYGRQCQRRHKYNLAINTGLLILEEMTGFDPRVTFPKLLEVYAQTLNLMSTCFKEMLKYPPNSPRSEELSAANVFLAIKFCTTIANIFPQTKIIVANIGETYYNAVHIYDFVFILDSIPRPTDIQEQLEECLFKYFRHDFQDGQFTVLHAAVKAIEENSLNNIKLILNLGADPNLTDESGQTPLHILAVMFKLHLTWFMPIFQAVVDAGGHLDMARRDGKTVLTLLSSTLKRYDNGSSLIAHPYFDSLVKSVFPLSCYCARIIRRNGIQFDEDRLPTTVQKFVSRHSSRGKNLHMKYNFNTN